MVDIFLRLFGVRPVCIFVCGGWSSLIYIFCANLKSLDENLFFSFVLVKMFSDPTQMIFEVKKKRGYFFLFGAGRCGARWVGGEIL